MKAEWKAPSSHFDMIHWLAKCWLNTISPNDSEGARLESETEKVRALVGLDPISSIDIKGGWEFEIAFRAGIEIGAAIADAGINGSPREAIACTIETYRKSAVGMREELASAKVGVMALALTIRTQDHLALTEEAHRAFIRVSKKLERLEDPPELLTAIAAQFAARGEYGGISLTGRALTKAEAEGLERNAEALLVLLRKTMGDDDAFDVLEDDLNIIATNADLIAGGVVQLSNGDILKGESAQVLIDESRAAVVSKIGAPA